MEESQFKFTEVPPEPRPEPTAFFLAAHAARCGCLAGPIAVLLIELLILRDQTPLNSDVLIFCAVIGLAAGIASAICAAVGWGLYRLGRGSLRFIQKRPTDPATYC